MSWDPQAGPQTSALLAAWADELFYGGERGGGKSDYLLGYQEDAALRYEGKSRGILFRKTYPEMEELQLRAMELFPAHGAVYKTQPSAQYPFSNCWFWPNGATCKMRYIERDQDYQRYHGHQYTHVAFDEIPEYGSPQPLLLMLSTLRSPSGVPCSLRSTGNPGGIGHHWVKSRYIDPSPPFTPFEDGESGLIRLFIPSGLEDNPILLSVNPRYRSNLLAATEGNEALRKAWMHGDWDVVAGAYFDCWNRALHVIEPFTVPVDWLRFRAFDWGSYRPFCVGWYAVSNGSKLADGRMYAPGCLIQYREWYGAMKTANGQIVPNVGLKMKNPDIAARILEIEKREPIEYGVADPACFIEQGGPSIAEQMKVCRWFEADNARIAGWNMLRSRLMGDEDTGPMIRFMSHCRETIRTLPTVVRDQDRLEDVDTESEDHAADMVRYASMSRPYVRHVVEKKQKAKYGTFDWMIKATEQEKGTSRYRSVRK